MIQNTKYKILNTKKRVALTGGAAAAEVLRQIDPDVMAVYPITPQTPIIETFAKFKADGKVATEIIQAESEHSAMSATIGASAAGARAVTATSSQGLALMHEMLYIASGMRLPVLMYVSARSLSAPLNIHGEHGDVMGSRDAGWVQIFCENAQEVYDNGIIGLKLTEKVKLPVMVIMDGFHTSHTVENLETADDEKIKEFIGVYKPAESLLDFENPNTFGFLALQDSYFDFKGEQQKAMDEVRKEYLKICSEFKEKFGRGYDIFENYKLDDAQRAIVIAGSTAGTAKEAVDKLRNEGKKVGLLKIKLFRPFPFSQIAEALKNVKKIAVLDRAISLGAYPPIYSDIINSSYKIQNTKYQIQSYIYGLGGRDTFQKNIEKVFEELEGEGLSKEIRYIK
jgi:pyruvate ferredoxin oxidoreductase alpha subunit